MFLRVNGPPKNWKDYRVLDLDKKVLIPNIVEADDETGRYTIMIKNPETGKPLVNLHRQPRVKSMQGNIKIMRADIRHPKNSQAPNIRKLIT